MFLNYYYFSIICLLYIKVEIQTNESGEFCTIFCPHFAGGCDAFGGEMLKRVPNTHSTWYRTEKCKSAEIKAPNENSFPNVK